MHHETLPIPRADVPTAWYRIWSKTVAEYEDCVLQAGSPPGYTLKQGRNIELGASQTLFLEQERMRAQDKRDASFSRALEEAAHAVEFGSDCGVLYATCVDGSTTKGTTLKTTLCALLSL